MKALYTQKIFPVILDHVMQLDSFTQARQQLLSGVTGHVVEVGFGTGLNLPFYGAGVLSLTAVDPNHGMNRLADPRIAQAKFPVSHRQLSAEKMPFETDSVDAVVSTWTLCSIPDVNAALAEIRRILKPTGMFYLVEHGLSPNIQLAKWQNRLTPVQKILADGCHLNRDIKKIVEQAGFEWVQCRHFNAAKVPHLFSWMTMGQAKKRDRSD